MSSIQVADQAFVASPPERVAAVVSPRARWRRWWPDLRIDVREDRGDKGIRWVVDGPLTGTMEVWLEPVLDGTVIHYFLHAEPGAGAPSDPDTLAAVTRTRRVQGKTMSFDVKRELEGGRAAGEAPA
ncbi:polyketide cyclase / dehydrase and lipid transport [Rhodococcus sp. HNM0569]|uniref:polyketide cyclase / dehydrase and lipid transport n=1 Tax=Rhodococcus sp. HNM0569 TaxID=2716340 RepID=UPI00146F9056|nr:polyketide cyclase / dehydrase and lipid transport [Rhodococcus sp. HNM0569]NLU82892.1 polyketide cyclase / dehydrase and lipid transport [Rhodococcus sp. HNM0569]